MTEHVPNQLEVEVLTHNSINEAYASVGGLSKQISEIRDLLEIPLTRPELFRHFGSLPLYPRETLTLTSFNFIANPLYFGPSKH